MDVFPRISIITVVRNGEKYIEQTISSILNQTYSNIEYIIIDGNSNDSTIEIVKKYDKKIQYWISEPDTGIYDAMNKGILASTGTWLLFINADDYLANDHVISDSIPYLNKSPNIIVYGRLAFVLQNETEIVVGDEWENIKHIFRFKTMTGINHQATFHHRSIFDSGLYNTKFKLAGDYDLLLKHLKTNNANFIPIIIAKMRHGGSSTQYYKTLFLEICTIYIQNRNYKIFFTKYWIQKFIYTYSHYYSNKLFGPNLLSRLKHKNLR